MPVATRRRVGFKQPDPVTVKPRPFAVRYNRPLWAMIYDVLVVLDVDEIITDQQLVATVPSGATWYSALRKAVEVLENEQSRTLDRVRGVGYRLVEAREHERLARGQHAKSRRALRRAIRKAHSADRSRLTPEERRRMDDLELHLAAHAQMLARLSKTVQQERRERKAETATLSDELAALKAMLARHGITDDEEARV